MQPLNVLNERMGCKKFSSVHTDKGLDQFRQFITHILSTSSQPTSSLWWDKIRAAPCVKSVRLDVSANTTLTERKVKSENFYFAKGFKNGNLHAYKTIILCLTEPGAEVVEFPECIKATRPCDAYVVFEDCDVMSKTYVDALNSKPTTWYESLYREFVLAFK
jgi:hypothetical protein